MTDRSIDQSIAITRHGDREAGRNRTSILFPNEDFIGVTEEDIIDPELENITSATSPNGYPPNVATITGTSTCAVAYDKTTPGLFKVEWAWNAVVGLCSKIN